jgi:hypothetical protein
MTTEERDEWLGLVALERRAQMGLDEVRSFELAGKKAPMRLARRAARDIMEAAKARLRLTERRRMVVDAASEPAEPRDEAGT